MDYQRPAYDPYATPAEADPTNALGLAGFVCSLIGVVTCGLLAPLGLLLSLFGLTRPPRGLAAAGTVIGFLGCVLGIMAVYVGVNAFHAAQQGLEKLGEEIQAQAANIAILQQARSEIEKHKKEHGVYPSDEEGQALIDDLTDSWGTTLRYKKTDEDTIDVRSAGQDRSFDTADDLESSFYEGVVAPIDEPPTPKVDPVNEGSREAVVDPVPSKQD